MEEQVGQGVLYVYKYMYGQHMYGSYFLLEGHHVLSLRMALEKAVAYRSSPYQSLTKN